MIDDILSPRRVFLDLKPEPKPALLRTITRALQAAGEVADAETLAQMLIRREEMITTGVKRGFAFPHAFTREVEDLGLTIGVVRGGTDYQSLDGEPVEVILMLLGPPDHQAHHLRVLARLSRIARKEGMLEALRDSVSPESMIELLSESDRLLTVR